MTPYFLLFLIPTLLALAVFLRRFIGVRALTPEELEGRLLISHSVRLEWREVFIDPIRNWFLQIYVPLFWRTADKLVRRFRLVLMRFETRLKHISDSLRGRHIKLDVQERSPYWQTLHGTKNNSDSETKVGESETSETPKTE